MDQYFVKILANIVTIDQQPLLSESRTLERIGNCILCRELGPVSRVSGVTAGHWCIVRAGEGAQGTNISSVARDTRGHILSEHRKVSPSVKYHLCFLLFSFRIIGNPFAQECRVLL